MLEHMAVLKGVALASDRKTTVEDLLHQTNLWNDRNKNLSGFSGGMRQRFGIAQALITDLFEQVTLYDLKVIQPTAVRRPDGKWDVTVPVEAKKFYVGDEGRETESPLAESIEIGLFTAEPGSDAFGESHAILFERKPIRSGHQVLKFVTDKKPVYAGIDPYNFYIDRIPADNIAGVLKNGDGVKR